MANAYLDAWRLCWQRAGLPAHPLMPAGGGWKGKELLTGCEDLPPDEAWREAYRRGDFWNMGVTPGSGYACVDADDSEAVVNLRAGFTGLGVAPVVELTPTAGHAHFWLRVAELPPGDVHLLAPAIGRGELRCHNANVAVTCSSIGDRKYRFATGGPEDIAGLPVVRFRDLTWVLPVGIGQASAPVPPVEALPLRLLWRDGSAAVAMLRELNGWPPGTSFGSYTSASEAEAAAVAKLILSGWSFTAIEAEFERCRPGAYWRRGSRRHKWLLLTWRRVLSVLCATGERAAIADTGQQVQSMTFPGRTGLLDQAVLSGLLARCWVVASWQVDAAERDLAEYAAASRHGVQNALDRLTAAGIVHRCGWQEGTRRYDLAGAREFGAIGHRGGGVSFGESGPLVAVKVVDGARAPNTGAENAGVAVPGGLELWSPALLGRSAGVVYPLLCEVPATVADLASSSGKHRMTVKRALERLQACGLAAPAGVGWVRGSANVAAVATVEGAPLHARMRHERHERERLAWDDTKARVREQ